MAIGNIVLGTATGKIGPLVMYHNGGQQITRTNSGKNGSRTYAQVKQRIRFCNPSLFYRLAHNAFFRFAFDDQKPNESEYNAFMRHNLIPNCSWLTKQQFNDGYIAPALYNLTSGPLKFDYIERSESVFYFRLSGLNYPFTMGEFWKSFIKKNQSLKEGDLITWVRFLHSTSTRKPAFYYNQFKVDFSDATVISSSSINLVDGGQYTIAATTWDLNFGTSSLSVLIISRNTPNGVICSNSKFVTTSSVLPVITQFQSPEAMHAAIDSFGYKDAILNPKQNE